MLALAAWQIEWNTEYRMPYAEYRPAAAELFPLNFLHTYTHRHTHTHTRRRRRTANAVGQVARTCVGFRHLRRAPSTKVALYAIYPKCWSVFDFCRTTPRSVSLEKSLSKRISRKPTALTLFTRCGKNSEWPSTSGSTGTQVAVRSKQSMCAKIRSRYSSQSIVFAICLRKSRLDQRHEKFKFTSTFEYYEIRLLYLNSKRFKTTLIVKLLRQIAGRFQSHDLKTVHWIAAYVKFHTFIYLYNMIQIRLLFKWLNTTIKSLQQENVICWKTILQSNLLNKYKIRV